MSIRMMRVRNLNMPVMTIEESRRSQRPYRYGMILLCFGALANWLGLAEHYAEPVRYLGVACIIAGALLICTAMCCWLHTPQRTGAFGVEEGNNSGNMITVPSEVRCEKPPDYDTVATLMPPSYDDAIKLNPGVFLAQNPSTSSGSPTVHLPTEERRKEAAAAQNRSRSSVIVNVITPPPPIYTIATTTVMPNEILPQESERSSSEVVVSRQSASAPLPR